MYAASPLKEHGEAHLFVKTPLNSPQEDPVVSIISDSLVSLMQEEEKMV